MSIYIDAQEINNEKYKIRNLEFYTKGDLKGYAEGLIEFSNVKNKEHEFLYRVYDPENGNSKTLVSIDYGYNNPMIKELWNEVEDKITEIMKGMLVVGNAEDLEFFKVCKDILES